MLLMFNDNRWLHSDVAAALEMLVRLHEAGAEYREARGRLQELSDHPTSIDRLPTDTLRREIERLGRLEGLGPNRRESLRKAQAATALIASSSGLRGTAVCIDPSGLFVAHASSLEGLSDETITQLEYDDRSPAISRVVARPFQGTARPVVLILGADAPEELSLPARIVQSSREHRLVLLKVDPPRPLPHLELDIDGPTRKGMEVLALGYPYVSATRSPPKSHACARDGTRQSGPRTIHWGLVRADPRHLGPRDRGRASWAHGPRH